MKIWVLCVEQAALALQEDICRAMQEQSIRSCSAVYIRAAESTLLLDAVIS